MRQGLSTALWASASASYATGVSAWAYLTFAAASSSPMNTIPSTACVLVTAPLWVPPLLVIAPVRSFAAGEMPARVIGLYWIVYVAVFVVACLRIVAGRERARRLAAGLCLHCGYELRGLRGRCPGCGEPVAEARDDAAAEAEEEPGEQRETSDEEPDDEANEEPDGEPFAEPVADDPGKRRA